MSVHLSQVDFNPQFTDEDEAELEREEREQQQKLKEFLDHELDDDDIFDVSFASYRSQGNRQGNHFSPPPKKTNGDGHLMGINENQNLHYDLHPVSSMNGVQNDHHNQMCSVGYMTSPTNCKHTSTHTPPQHFYNGSNHYNMPDDAYNNNMVHNDGYQVDGKQYIEDSQLHVLYNARGKKIESLQHQIEETEERFQKDIRVLTHKLTMMTSEKDGISTSFQQQQNLLQEHKQQMVVFEKQLTLEQEEKRQLNNQIKELNEKLYVSDCAVDTLQTQIKQINQTESMSRARAQHESMLATVRQRHEEEILTLKEKLDDLQQALAWKTEDLNRYREMVDQNSSVSEISILRNRLTQEETKNKYLKEESEKDHKKYVEIEDQLKLYEGLVEVQAAHLTSTPLTIVGSTNMDKEEFDPKTPISRIQDGTIDTCGRGPNDSSFREELVKSLSKNREKRQQINVLRDQLEYFQKQLHVKKSGYVQDRNTQTDETCTTEALVSSCDQCEKIQCDLEEKTQQIEQHSMTLKNEINQLLSDNRELKTNMADMVKNFDKQKVIDMQSHNRATLQLIDDAKANLLKEVEKIHAEERSNLQNEIESLNGELLYTKEEYLKLCTEVKDLEDRMRNEFNVDRNREVETLKQSFERDCSNLLSKQEMSLASKHIEDMENEKHKWEEENEKEMTDKMERAVMLAKADWIENYNVKRGESFKQKEELEMNNMKEKCEKYESELKELEQKCLHQTEDFNIQFEGSKVAWENENKTEFNKKLEEEKTKMETSMGKTIKEHDNEHESVIKKLQAELNEQSSSLRKTELDFKLKTALWNRTENEMKRKLESLEKEASNKILICEKCEEEKKRADLDISDSNIGKEMCLKCTRLYKSQENEWQAREKDLLMLLEEAQEQIRHRLGSLRNSVNAESNKSVSLDSEVAKENEYRVKIEELSEEVKKWKEKYDEYEICVSELKQNIQTIKEDTTLNEKNYKSQLDNLQNELTSVKEMLANARNDLSTEREKINKASLESRLLRSKLLETEKKLSQTSLTQKLEDSKHGEEVGKLAEEIKAWMQRYNTLQNEISNLKETLSTNQNKLADKKEKCTRLEFELKTLSESSIAENRSKQKRVESEYENKIEDFTAECKKWKDKYNEVEKENIEQERNIQLQLTNVTDTENYYKKQVDTLQKEIVQLKESLSQFQNNFYVEKDRGKKLELECKQLTDNYGINLENVLSLEKQKWQIESSKLQEAVLKASEIDHNNFVKEIQNQTNHINEINKIKEEHVSDANKMKEEHDILVRNLKQGFRDKLARITEMKKRWIHEEEEKRSHIEKNVKDKYTCKLNDLQQQNENILRDQQSHWIKEIHQSKKEQLKTLVGLREEVKLKDMLLLKERKTFEENEMQTKKKMKDFMTQHNQRLEKLEIEHLNDLQREKRRLEQYYKLMNGNQPTLPMSSIEVSQEMKDTLKSGNLTKCDAVKDHNIKDDGEDNGKIHQFYIETLGRIQEDVLHHIATMRKNADIEIREAVEMERKKIFQELKKKERSMTTSSPRLEKDQEFGSAMFLNSLDYGSCLDLPQAT